MQDLYDVGGEPLTITRYARPTAWRHPFERWVKSEESVEICEEAMVIRFAGALSGPLVRSSHRTGRLDRVVADRRTHRWP